MSIFIWLGGMLITFLLLNSLTVHRFVKEARMIFNGGDPLTPAHVILFVIFWPVFWVMLVFLILIKLLDL